MVTSESVIKIITTDVSIISKVLLQGYSSLRQLTKLSKLSPPKQIMDEIQPIKDDDEAILKFGIKYATEMCRELLDSGVVSLIFHCQCRPMC